MVMTRPNKMNLIGVFNVFKTCCSLNGESVLTLKIDTLSKYHHQSFVRMMELVHGMPTGGCHRIVSGFQ